MAKASKSKKSAEPKVDPYLDGVIAKLVDRLTGMERKMDTLLSKMGNISSGSNQSKPSQEPQSRPQSQQHQAPQQSQQSHQSQQPQRKERTLYEAICADCAKVCEVPFRPVEGRAVYCKECFGKRKNRDSRPGMPILTPTALPPKPVSKLSTPVAAAAAAPQKSKKKAAPKKAKKGKR